MADRRIVRLSGRVQGVGFRDHVVALAQGFAIEGTVRNSAGEVEIDVEGETAELERFLGRLAADVPRGARVERTAVESAPMVHHRGFRRTATRD